MILGRSVVAHKSSIPSILVGCCGLLLDVVGFWCRCCSLLVAVPDYAVGDPGVGHRGSPLPKDHRYDSLMVVKSGNTAGLPRAAGAGGVQAINLSFHGDSLPAPEVSHS